MNERMIVPGDLFVIKSAWNGTDDVSLCDGPGPDYVRRSTVDYGTVGFVVATLFNALIGNEAFVVLSDGRTGWVLARHLDIAHARNTRSRAAVKARGPLV